MIVKDVETVMGAVVTRLMIEKDTPSFRLAAASQFSLAIAEGSNFVDWLERE